MRLMVFGLLTVCLACSALSAADDELNEKTIIGLWGIKTVGGDVKFPNTSMELKDDGTFVWRQPGKKTEGKYELKTTTLELTPKGKTDAAFIWKDLSMKDGKIIRPTGKGVQEEWTKLKDKK